MQIDFLLYSILTISAQSTQLFIQNYSLTYYYIKIQDFKIKVAKKHRFLLRILFLFSAALSFIKLQNVEGRVCQTIKNFWKIIFQQMFLNVKNAIYRVRKDLSPSSTASTTIISGELHIKHKNIINVGLQGLPPGGSNGGSGGSKNYLTPHLSFLTPHEKKF